MIVDRHAQNVLRPEDRIWIGPFPRKVERAQARQIVFLAFLALGIVPFHGPDRRGRGEEAAHVMFFDDAPEGAGIRCADGFAFEDDGRVPVYQRRITDVGMPHDPAYVRRRPEDLSRFDVIDVLHAPVERDQMARRMAHHALGRAGGAGGIEDIGGVVALHRDAVRRGDAFARFVPVEIPALGQGAGLLFALKDDAELGLVGGQFDGPVDQRFVGDDAPGLQPAGGGEDRLGLAVVDTHRQFICRETAEDDGMDGADAGAGQHRFDRFGDHGHIDHHAVALCHAMCFQHPGQRRDTVAHLAEGDVRFGSGDGAVVDDGYLIRAPVFHMAVDRVVTAVQLGIGIPFVGIIAAIEQGLLWWFDPVNVFRQFQPEAFRVVLPAFIGFAIAHHSLLLNSGDKGVGEPWARGKSALSLNGKVVRPFREKPWTSCVTPERIAAKAAVFAVRLLKMG